MRYKTISKLMDGLQVALVVTLGLLAAGCFLVGHPLAGLGLAVLSGALASL